MLVFSAANFSEGRRKPVVDALVAAVAASPDVRVLDVHSDADHNRSVLSCAGAPQALVDSLFAGIRCAAQLIDMETHEGQHPRFGAADVIPLVPLQGVTMERCRALARTLGLRVGHELQLPVYLYAASARRPHNVRLVDLRRGGYEGLRAVIDMDEQRCPDYGPASMGSAGAVAIGARDALVAFNVWLSTPDIRIAQRIARRIRASGGGLAGVQALGLLVGGRAQVSMNLSDYRRTGLAQVMATLHDEAAREGVTLQSSELVGLIPQAAVDAAAGCDLLLRQPIEAQILERRLWETGLLRSMTQIPAP